MTNRKVAIFREELLPSSETFIAAQARAMRSYSPFFFGLRYLSNSLIRREEVAVAYDEPFAGIKVGIARGLGVTSRRLVSSLSRERCQLIHAHFGPDGTSALAISKRVGIPLAVTFHGYDATVYDECLRTGGQRKRRYLARRDALRSSGAHFIAVSNFISSQLRGLGFPEDRIRVHYIGVDTTYFRAPHTREVPDCSVLFVGRLVPKKGLMDLLSAVMRLKDVMRIRVTVIGAGPEREVCQAFASTLPDVTFLGSAKPEEVRAAMLSHRVFCVPSRTAQDGDREGFGIVFAEAQAMGTPVVSYDSGGVSEAVLNGVRGFLAPEGDIKTLSEYLRTVLSMSDESWHELSARSAEFVEKNLSLDSQTRILESFYDEILDSERSTSKTLAQAAP